MDHLFNRLDGSYPNRWRAAFANAQAIQNWREAWSEAFSEEGVTTQDISNAIRSCRKMYDWPPSLPEFLKACKPNIDNETAFYEAVQQMVKRATNEDQWSHPAIYWAAVQMGTDLNNNPYALVKNRWIRALTTELAKGSWDEIPRRLEALVAPGKCYATPEEARGFINQILGRSHKATA